MPRRPVEPRPAEANVFWTEPQPAILLPVLPAYDEIAAADAGGLGKPSALNNYERLQPTKNLYDDVDRKPAAAAGTTDDPPPPPVEPTPTKPAEDDVDVGSYIHCAE